jgi:D-alanyl-lipoteichoic acid acyltransferase DltB (MBOAT superfamily)
MNGPPPTRAFAETLGGRAGIARFAAQALQLGLLVAVADQFQLENPILTGKILPLAFVGFVVHHLLPPALRLRFFVLLSVGGIVAALGPVHGGILLAIGLVLIGLCHLPAPFGLRVLLVAVAAGALAAVRTGSLPTKWGGIVVPVLASMFMFRLIVYLYDLRHGRVPFSPSRALAYFFLLPNVAFPLFPAVDYAGFAVRYYDENAYRIYQRGLRWMVRGVVHLILYRAVNYWLVIGPEEVESAAGLARYVLANFLLYLKVSGQFHLIVGMLLLFGFNLPETHHLYYLASSFSDFWRRINIYWKDFMQKLFFMPLFFRLKAAGDVPALVVATFTTFVVTWFLHAWQWFWLRGTYLFTAPDILFWTLLAALVVVNSLVENRRGRARSLSARKPGARELAVRSVATVLTFAVICTLWSLWISDSVGEWLSLWSSARLGAGSAAAAVGVLLLASAALFAFFWMRRGAAPPSRLHAPPPSARAMAATTLTLAALLVVGQPAVYFRLGPRAVDALRDLRADKLSRRDAVLLERGYYENLTAVNRFNSELWEVYMQRPTDWKLIQDSDAVRPTGDFLGHELRPSLDMIFKDAPLTTNRYGMRDREYEVEAPPGTYRIALLGGSHSMGSGVADQETFEALIEERLNRENAGGERRRWEILNFAVGGWGDLHAPFVLEKRALPFRPDAMIYIGHPRNEVRVLHHLATKIHEGVDLPHEALREFAARVGAEAGMPVAEIENRLRPLGDEVNAWALRRLAELCREHGVLPIWICLPAEAGQGRTADVDVLVRMAEDAGFVALDLSGVYGDTSPDVLRVAPWDMHPNALGHRMLADGIYDALRGPLGLGS